MAAATARPGRRFRRRTGLVVDGGREIALSRGTDSNARIDVKPLIVSTGIAFRF